MAESFEPWAMRRRRVSPIRVRRHRFVPCEGGMQCLRCSFTTVSVLRGDALLPVCLSPSLASESERRMP